MRDKNKTIFLVALNGFSVRYLLRNDILRTVKKAGTKIVILFGGADQRKFQREFKDENVFIEKLQNEKYKEYERRHKFTLVFKRVKRFTLNGRYDTSTIDKFYEIDRKKIKAAIPWYILLFESVIIALIRNIRFLRAFIVWIESKLFRPQFHRELFFKYKPGMVVVSTLGYLDYDYYMMREAKQHGAKIISIILSWDNTSSKGMGGAKADHIITWTENMKREIVEFHDISESKISVGGVAHFDDYYRRKTFMSRDDFLDKFDLDCDRKIIFFATKSPSAYPWNPYIVELIAKAIDDNKFLYPCQLLVRIHPNQFVKKHSVLVSKETIQEVNMNQFYELKEKYPFIVYSIPKVHIDVSYDIDASENKILASVIKYSDVVVNLFSTINLEASIMDKPLINVGFNGPGNSPTGNPRHDIRIDELQFHNQRVVKSGAIKIARNEEELMAYINMYLKDKTLDSDKRKRLCREECGLYPGKAGQNIGSILLKQLYI